MSLIYSILIVIIYCLACFGIGRFAMSAIRVRRSGAVPALTFAVATFILGQAVLAAIWVPIGLVGQLNIYFVGIVLLVGVIPAIPCLKEFSHSFAPAIKSGFQKFLGADLPFQIIAAGTFGLMFLFFLSALVSGPLGDAEAYYMAYPKVMAASGHLSEMPGLYSPFSQIGILGELHFSALMTLGVTEASKLLVLPIAVSAGLMLALICKQAGVNREGQWMSFVILFTSTGFTNHIWDGKVDVFPVALGLVAVYWIMSEERLSEAGLRVIGLVSGFALVAKFSYIPILVPSFFLLIAWRLYVSTEGEFSPREYIHKLTVDSVALGFWFSIAWVPHLFKNWILFDAPLAPFIGMAPSLSLPWFSSEDTEWILKTYPLALVFGRYPGQSGNLSFLWLALLPLVFFAPRKNPILNSPLVQLTVIGIVGVIIWMLIRPSWIAPRYIFISLALLIPVVAWATGVLYAQEGKFSILRAGILATTLSALFFVSYPHITNTVVKIFDNSAKGDCALAGAYCGAFKRLNSMMPYGSRMYFVGYFGYWARPDMLQCQLSNYEMKSLDRMEDGNERWNYLVERGVEYIVVDPTSYPSQAEEFGAEMAPSWINRELIIDNSELKVWRLLSLDAGRLAMVRCSQVGPGNWQVVK